MKHLCKKKAFLYLEKYAEKDIHRIAKLFADDILLRDWKIKVKGKDEAINETQKNFLSVDTLQIDILGYYENQDTIALELKITIDHKEELYVMDVIKINSEGKIISIKAFLGRD